MSPHPTPSRCRGALLLVVLMLAVGLLAGCLTPHQEETLQALNADRTKLHLKALPLHAVAKRKAQSWADHLAAGGTFEHSTLSDGFAGVRWCSIGENIGYGPSVTSIQKAYMASPGHRANITSTKWNSVGVGYATSGKRVYTVQVFLKTC